MVKILRWMEYVTSHAPNSHWSVGGVKWCSEGFGDGVDGNRIYWGGHLVEREEDLESELIGPML